jgi:hypothetical protein
MVTIGYLYAGAGFDEVHVLLIGPRQRDMAVFCARNVLPRSQ